MDWSDRDVIAIKNLSLPHPVLAPDAWSFTPSALANNTPATMKAQPATVSMELVLKPQSFANAACDDTVNPAHTVHYGEVSKAVRANSFEGQDVFDVLLQMAGVIGDRKAVTDANISISLSKGSMTGQSTLITHTLEGFERDVGHMKKGDILVSSGSLVVTGIPLTCLIGVNANERTGKQPLLLDYHVRFEGDGQVGGEKPGRRGFERWANRNDSISAALAIETYLREVGIHSRETQACACKIERVIDHRLANVESQIIESTSFETLESLIEFAYSQLRRQLLDEQLPGATIRIKLSKPRAIIFADAPTVEIQRTVPLNKLQQNIGI
jgi:dihydroneopterin aldolase